MRTALRVTTHTTAAVAAMTGLADSVDESGDIDPLIGGRVASHIFHHTHVDRLHQSSSSILAAPSTPRAPCTPELSSASSVYSTPSLSRRSSSSGCSKSVRFAPCLAASIHFTHSADTYDRTPIVPAPASESLVLPPHSKSEQDSWLRAAARSAAVAHYSTEDVIYGDDASTPYVAAASSTSYFPPENTSVSTAYTTIDMMLELGVQQDDNHDNKLDSHGLCAMGKWSRGDLYGSCDVLGGF